MNIENMEDLAKVRYERAVELAEEAQDLLDKEHYTSTIHVNTLIMKICKYLESEGIL
jgi:hypothetical protein